MTAHTYEPYPAYKDTRIEWMGVVPTHWDVAKMWHVSTARSGGTPSKDEPAYWNGDIPWVSPKDMKRSVIDSSEDTVTEQAISETSLRIFQPPVVLIVVRGMILAHSFPVALTSVPVTINQDMKAITFSDRILPEFAVRFLQGVGKQVLATIVEEAGHGTKVVRMDEWRSVPLAIPPVAEQQAIVAYLDRATKLIDERVAKWERLIALLQERRNALITNAVTKGLDAAVSKKDSEEEWLGTIPTHWQAARLRRVLTWIEQGWSPDCENREADGNEWGVLKAGCVNSGKFVESEHKALPASERPIPNLEVREGDLLMSRASGSRELVGSVAVVPACRPRLLLCDKVFRLHLDEHQMRKRFAALALNSRVARSQIESVLSGGRGLANNIAQSVVKDLLVALPPRDEQDEIVSYVNRHTDRLGRLNGKIKAILARMSEKRVALIHAAVTGQIDVRKYSSSPEGSNAAA